MEVEEEPQHRAKAKSRKAGIALFLLRAVADAA